MVSPAAYAACCWLVLLTATSILLTALNIYYLNLLIWPMLFHGGHELLHLSLFSRRRTGVRVRYQPAELLGVLVYALFGHHYYILRDSHLQHHVAGRLPIPAGLIDHRHETYTFAHRVEYFASLVGLNYWAYVFAGPLFLLSPWAFRRAFFRPKVRRDIVFVGTQVIVFAWAALVIFHIDFLDIILTHLVFSVYWGLIQNSAHYSLPVGEINARYAARSYSVPRWLKFVFFGSPFLHLEHHVFPRLPSSDLDSDEVRRLVCAKLGIEGYPRRSLADFMRDLIYQLATPLPVIDRTWQEVPNPKKLP